MMKKILFARGFSLVELAVVLAILGLVFVGFTSGIGSFYHSANMEESKNNQAAVKQQIMNFGVVNRFLPCPDTDGDGLENRNGNGCAADIGAVPFLSLGLSEELAQDSWGNNIRYAVNRNADNAGFVCNKNSSASMFCNAGAATNTAWFTLTDTPPFATNRGDGNYFVCNDTATTADCAGTPNNDDLLTDTAVAVLVSYNEDGVTTFTNCGATAGATNENCDTDDLYHQARLSYADNARFDDIVTFITGQEVKSGLLSSLVSWNSFDVITQQNTLTPTFQTFDLSTDADVAAAGTSDKDIVFVNRNVSKSVDFGDKADYLAIGNDLEAGADIDMGKGADTLYIIGSALADINLGGGSDTFVLVTNLINALDAGNGEDLVWIMGNIESQATLDMGKKDDILWVGNHESASAGNINAVIDGGYQNEVNGDILILENFASWTDFDASGQNANVKNFEWIIFSDDGFGNRNFVQCANDASDRCTNFVP